MEPQLLCLRWNNHQSNLVTVFDQLLQNEAFCDVTLAVEGRTVKCHQMVLAAASPYFQSIFMEKPCPHPIVFLKDISYAQLRHLLEYIYYGEASVHEDELQGLLKIAESLKIKGLVEIEDKPINDSIAEPRPRSSNLTPSGKPASIWPSSPAKLLSNPPRDRNDDDGVLVIDEESSDSAPPAVAPVEVNHPDYSNNYLEESPPAPGMVRVVGANGKAEWKRYKQYTKDDIVAAIEEVKNGMSALQASRKYGVPSRTLYDKVKKMGILTANMQKQIQQKKPQPQQQQQAAPQINLLGLQLPQASLPSNAGTPSVAQPPVSLSTETSTPSLPPGNLMMSVMSMMTEKLHNINNQNQSAPVSLSNLLRHSSQLANSREGSDSGHSSSDLGEGEGAIKEEVTDEPAKNPPLNPAYLLSQLVNMKRGESNSQATTNGGTSHSVTLTPREEQPLPLTIKEQAKEEQPLPLTTSTTTNNQEVEEEQQQPLGPTSLKRKAEQPTEQMADCKKSLVEPIKQEQESI